MTEPTKNPKEETVHLLEEVDFFMSLGMDRWDIAFTLGRLPQSIAVAGLRNGRPDIKEFMEPPTMYDPLSQRNIHDKHDLSYSPEGYRPCDEFVGREPYTPEQGRRTLRNLRAPL